MSYLESTLNGIDSFFAWLSSSLKQTTESYCDLETADDDVTLVTHDGALISMIKIHGATALMGADEFDLLHQGMTQSLTRSMSRSGHAIQVYFEHSKERIEQSIADNFQTSIETSKRLGLNLDDLFYERQKHLSNYCAHENVYFVLWTRPTALSAEQVKSARARQTALIKENNLPHFHLSQNLMAAIPDLRNIHQAFIRSTIEDLDKLNLSSSLLNVHEALYHVRMTVDPNFTDRHWRPCLPGDHIPVREIRHFKGDVS